MTTATKEAPKAATAPAPAAKPELDLTKLTAIEGGNFVQNRGRGKVDRLEGTPIRGWVKTSREAGNKPMTVPVPKDAFKTVASLIRLAGAEQKVGIRIGNPLPITNDPNRVALVFKTADPRDMSPEAVAKRATAKAKRDAKKTA